MVNTISRIFGKGLCSPVMIAVWSCGLMAAAPPGWHISGSNRTDYESGVDPAASNNGHPSAYLRSKQPFVEGFGTLMQGIRADHYLGKRVRLSALVRTEETQGSAGLWMRVDKGNTPLAFDNMQDRPIKGTTGWKEYEVVLEVPQDATGIFFGVLLGQSGTVWINTVKFETVSGEVPTTGRWTPPAIPRTPARATPCGYQGNAVKFPEEPRNLDFETN